VSRKKRLQKKAEKGKKAEQKKQAYASRVATKPKTKKKKRTVEEGRAYIKSTFNNTIITITDNKGDVLATASAGARGFRGSKKSTSFAASKAAGTAVAKADNVGMHKISIFVTGVGTGRDAAIRSLAGSGMEVLAIKDITPIPHNGPRPRRPRRT